MDSLKQMRPASEMYMISEVAEGRTERGIVLHISAGFLDIKVWTAMDVVAAGIDIQGAPPFGTADDVREMVRRWSHFLPPLPLLDN